MDIDEILSILPHRYPFLFIDKIVELTDERIVALKNVTINEPFFSGHFPNNPIMPGVIMVEAVAQAGGLFASQFYRDKSFNNYQLFLMGLDKVRFRKVVRPGMTLKIVVNLIKRKKDAWRMKGVVYNNTNDIVCELEFIAMMTKKE
ncbi:MAG: 3-hydroxyacyl-ACP dehydratase FabZ [Deferribacterota bacterium]|nr:3-hydroxyacyl-ACP dehydratase FabZ [Deferribacterota bacterium]